MRASKAKGRGGRRRAIKREASGADGGIGISTSSSSSSNGNVRGIIVRSVLVPRRTSFLAPLRLLSLLLMSASFNSCVQTSGRPLEDAVRRILGMPSPSDDGFASRVTPLHIYVARKVACSSSSSSTAPVEALPPGHLPSPLPLLGLFLSVLLFVGGTVLLPRWDVGFDVFLNYVRHDVDGDVQRHDNRAACVLRR